VAKKTKIKILRSVNSGNTPSLDSGEIGINEYDGILYYRDFLDGSARPIWYRAVLPVENLDPTGASLGYAPVFDGTEYVPTQLAAATDYVAKAGDTMSGNLVVNAQVGIGRPISKTNTSLELNDALFAPADDHYMGGLTVAVGNASQPSIQFDGTPGTGIFRPEISVFAIATGGQERVRVSNDGVTRVNGRLGINNDPNEDTLLGFSGTCVSGILCTATQKSGSSCNVFYSYASSAGTGSITHFLAQTTAGSGTPTQVIGFDALDAIATGATNYGFRSTLDEEAGKTNYQIYASGDAPSLFLGQIEANLGDPARPSYSFNGDTNTGLFRAGADAVGISTNSAERVRIDSAGRFLVGISAATGRNVYFNKQHAGSSGTSTQLFVGGSIGANTQSGTDAAQVRSELFLAGNSGNSYSLSRVSHFIAQENSGGISADASLSEQVGFYITGLSAATSNRGLRIGVNEAANQTNHVLYCDGDAPSYFNGNIGIGVTDPNSRLSVTGPLPQIRSNTIAPQSNASHFYVYNKNGSDYTLVVRDDHAVGIGKGNAGNEKHALSVKSAKEDADGNFQISINSDATYSNLTATTPGDITTGKTAYGYRHASTTENSSLAEYASFIDAGHNIQNGGETGNYYSFHAAGTNPVAGLQAGFYSEINISTGGDRYAFLATGTAPSSFGGRVGIGTTDPAASLHNAEADFQPTQHYFEKEFEVTFPHGVANQKFKLEFQDINGLGGLFQIEGYSGWANQIAFGVLRKTYVFAATGASAYTNTSYYTEAHGPIINNFAFGEFTYDSANQKWYVPIVHRTSTGNALKIKIRVATQTEAVLARYRGIVATSIYTTDTTTYDAPSVSVPGNLESLSLTTESIVGQHDTYNPTVGHLVYSGVTGHLGTGMIGNYVPGSATVTFRKQLTDGATNTTGVRFDAPVYGDTSSGSAVSITKYGLTCYPDSRGDLVDFVHFDAGSYYDSTTFTSDAKTEFVDVVCYNAQNVFYNATGDVVGFKSNISVGAQNNKAYAFYAGGNAPSYFNGDVGIGTDEPAAPLHVSTEVTNSAKVLELTGTSWGTGEDLRVDFTRGADVAASIQARMGVTTPSAKASLVLYTGGSERVWIDQAGSVGINYDLPKEKLDVNGSFGVVNCKTIKRGTVAVPSGAGSTFLSDPLIVNTQHYDTLNQGWSYVVWATAIGTGTDTGARWLVWYDEPNSTWVARTISRASEAFNNQPRLLVSDAGTATAKIRLWDNHAGATPYTYSYTVEAFLKGEADGTAHSAGADYHWQRLVDHLVYTDGNVGIGTTTPGALLDVNGDATVSGNLTVTGSISGTVAASSTSPLTLEGTGMSGGTLQLGAFPYSQDRDNGTITLGTIEGEYTLRNWDGQSPIETLVKTTIGRQEFKRTGDLQYNETGPTYAARAPGGWSLSLSDGTQHNVLTERLSVESNGNTTINGSLAVANSLFVNGAQLSPSATPTNYKPVGFYRFRINSGINDFKPSFKIIGKCDGGPDNPQSGPQPSREIICNVLTGGGDDDLGELANLFIGRNVGTIQDVYDRNFTNCIFQGKVSDTQFRFYGDSQNANEFGYRYNFTGSPLRTITFGQIPNVNGIDLLASTGPTISISLTYQTDPVRCTYTFTLQGVALDPNKIYAQLEAQWYLNDSVNKREDQTYTDHLSGIDMVKQLEPSRLIQHPSGTTTNVLKFYHSRYANRPTSLDLKIWYDYS